MALTGNETVIYSPSQRSLIDFVGTKETVGQAFDRLMPRYGNDLIAMALDTAIARQEDAYRSPVQEITEEQWFDALEVLPPVAWKNTADGESFKMSERLSGSITGIYVRKGGRCFMFNDSITLPHAECCARVVL
jgi:hypothetical protein